MSNIFDALQRAESESSGSEAPGFSLATELLQAAEKKMREADASRPLARVESSGPISARELLQAAEQKMREADVVQPQAWVETSRPASGTELVAADASKTRDAGNQPARVESIGNPAASSFDDLERCPVLQVSIPQDTRLIAVGKEESLGAEKFRFLAVRLRQLRQTRPLKKILITSTIPQEGKSTVAANLACTLARRKQQKTLLLEGDLRRPTLAARFGLGRIPGLCEWLSGQTEGINLYRLESLGLWVLPAGAAPQNPLELMQSGKLAPLMNQLEAWFDWIVIDSPPVLPLADASMWSRLADGILLVTRNGTTEKRQLKRGIEAIEKSKLLGALVNSSANAAHTDYYQRYSAQADQSKD
ncbi:MAG: CpsD/CapB family tyrosine-protein kinase [Candidatus Sulfotelmatobacter sp.]